MPHRNAMEAARGSAPRPIASTPTSSGGHVVGMLGLGVVMVGLGVATWDERDDAPDDRAVSSEVVEIPAPLAAYSARDDILRDTTGGGLDLHAEQGRPGLGQLDPAQLERLNAALGREVTLSIWMRLHRLDELQFVFGGHSAQTSDSRYNVAFCFYNVHQSLDFFVKGDGGLQYRQATGTQVADRWYHAVGTYDGAETRVYLDGRLVGTGRGLTQGELFELTSFSLGFDPNDGSRELHGDVDDARVYAVALDAKQVAALYQRGRAFAEPTPWRDLLLPLRSARSEPP